MASRALPLLALLAAAVACASRVDPRLVAQPIASRTWVSTLHRDHPLVGKIWDPRAGRFTDEAALAAAVAGADVVLLGEMHDNVDHHVLQARLVRAVLVSGRRPALAFEMLTSDQQATVDAALARAPRDPDAFAKAVAWDESGWPEFEMYRPIFQAGLEAGVAVIAANLPRKAVREVVSKGAEALDAPLRARLAKDEPLPAPLVESLRAEMRESHCGELPESLIDPLILAQRARDAEMAARVEGAGGRGAILIAGRGHVRTDRGVPAYVRRDAPGRKIVSVAFFEVEPGQREAAAYNEPGESGPLPFDYAVFTPGQEREDPCEKLRHGAHERAAREKAEPRPKEAGPPAGAAPPAAPGTPSPRDGSR
ncbi:MAG TPA: ChaN family lipoprotein [Anaeromyxobacter sp.]